MSVKSNHKTAHLVRWQENRKFSRDAHTSHRYAWSATVMFYAALHLVEAYLVHSGLPDADACDRKHKQRNALLEERFSDVWVLYEKLFDDSLTARYNPSSDAVFTNNRVKYTLGDKSLGALEMLICPRMGLDLPPEKVVL